MKLTATQRQMVEGGFPACLIVTPAETARRAKYWESNPPRAMPLFQLDKTRDEDGATAAFRAQETERRRLNSLRQIDRMKARMAMKKIDHSKMRWDPRRNRFVEDTGMRRTALETVRIIDAAPSDKRAQVAGQMLVEGQDWSRVNKDTARTLAELNGVWDAKYEKLSGGLLVMTISNKLKTLVKKGETIEWLD